MTEETLCCVIRHLAHVPRDLLHGENRAKTSVNEMWRLNRTAVVAIG